MPPAKDLDQFFLWACSGHKENGDLTQQLSRLSRRVEIGEECSRTDRGQLIVRQIDGYVADVGQTPKQVVGQRSYTRVADPYGHIVGTVQAWMDGNKVRSWFQTLPPSSLP